ncbi:MAG: ATP-binding cassette domain-containing protein [Alphaproteobacteria bacterium]
MNKISKTSLLLPSFTVMTKEILRRLWPKSGEAGTFVLRVRLISALSLSLITITLSLLVPIAFKNLVNSLHAATLTTTVVVAVAAYALIHFLRQMTWQSQELIVTKNFYNIANTLQHNIFCHLQKLPLSFHLKSRAGAINTILSRVNHSVFRFTMTLIFYFTALAIEIVSAVTILGLEYGGRYVALIFGSGVLYVSMTVYMWRRYSLLQDRANDADNQAGAKGLDSLVNFQAVHVFNNRDYEEQCYADILKQREKLSTKKENTMIGMFIWHSGTTSLAVGLVTAMSVWDVYHAHLSLGDVVMINAYLLQIAGPLIWMGMVLGEMAEAGNNLRQVLGLFSIKPTIVNQLNAATLQIKDGQVRFENVSFAYDQRPILQDVSFTIYPGQKVAIVGATGAGKSTISNLLLRFFEPQQGRILVDEQDIQSVTLESLRAPIGLVPQDTTLFNETIYTNIHYGNLRASKEELIAAAKAAGIHSFIESLPQGYQMFVGERGLQLSGGEKQRVAIARCLLKKPAIFIFDEATSALDTHTEREIQKSLNEAAIGATTLVIAHRLSTVMHADQIIVLDRGSIIEQGTHQELLNRQGHYAHLWQRQIEDGEAIYPEEEAVYA